MKYFFDTEFQEGMRKPLFEKEKHFIDLISIGIVSELGKEYYAVCKDFNLKRVWENKWLRENVLRPIHNELCKRQSCYAKTFHYKLFAPFTLSSMKNLISWHGKDRATIRNEILIFTDTWRDGYPNPEVEFYGYYCDYDWVLFCSLFERMIDMPENYPKYCIDLRQTMDERGCTKAFVRANVLKPACEHDALSDAKWNKSLFLMLNNFRPE